MQVCPQHYTWMQNKTEIRAGSALAVKNWAWQLTHPGRELPSETPYSNQNLLIDSVKETLEAGKKQSGRSPKVLVIGAVRHSLFGR